MPPSRAVTRVLGRLRGLNHFNCLDQDTPTWEERANAAVALCRSQLTADTRHGDVWTIADLGCGNRRLEKILAQERDLPHEYRGYDLHPQSERTMRVDLLRETPPGHADLAFVLGVLEYIADLASFFQRLHNYASLFIFSYVVVDSTQQLSTEQRRRIGWRTHHSSDEIASLLAAAGYQIVDTARCIGDSTAVWLTRTAHDG
jgi:predicted TPR repeat methyltransferase